MALRTLCRRSSENTLQVAPLTFNLRMAAAEWEAGRTVIDFDISADSPLSSSDIRHQQHRAAYHKNSSNYCRRKELKPRSAYRLSHACTYHCSSIALSVAAYDLLQSLGI